MSPSTSPIPERERATIKATRHEMELHPHEGLLILSQASDVTATTTSLLHLGLIFYG